MKYYSPILVSKYMKIALILVILYPVLTFGQNKMTDAEFKGFIGPVKTIIERQTLLPLNQSIPIEQPRRFITVSDFDRQGRIILRREYGTGKQTVFVDINDTIVSIQQTLDETEPLDDSRLLKTVTILIPEEVNEKTMPLQKFKRDEKGRIIGISGYRIDGSQTILYTYNDYGLNTEWRLYGTLSGTVITSLWYNESNFPIEVRQFTSTTTHTKKYINYKYDSKGNWTERIEQDMGFTQHDLEFKRKNDSHIRETRENRAIIYY